MNNTIFNKMTDLPDDLKNKVYMDHFHIKYKCDKLLKWFNDNYKLNCNPNEVEELTDQILSDKEGVEYMMRQNNFFKLVYKMHFIDNLHPKVGFKLLNRTKSLILTILMCMWH